MSILKIGIFIHKIRYIKEPADTTCNQIINILGKASFLLKNNQIAASVKNDTMHLRLHKNINAITIDTLFPALNGKRNMLKVSIKNPDISNKIIIDVKASKSFMARIIISLRIAFPVF